ncbi:MAG TPA: hypothetical protein VEA98_00510 [Brevundimonas sp.]|nr:hypothetical protein [Brevundimonas sp.]
MIAVLVLALVAPDYLTEVVGEPITTTGTTAEIATRAEACAAQTLNAGADEGPVILSSDPASGVVVARNSLEYRDGLLPWRMRSRITIEARDGRFRIRHSAIERHDDQSFGAQVLGASPWAPVGKWRGSGWQKAEAALQETSRSLAACITSSGPSSDDW